MLQPCTALSTPSCSSHIHQWKLQNNRGVPTAPLPGLLSSQGLMCTVAQSSMACPQFWHSVKVLQSDLSSVPFYAGRCCKMDQPSEPPDWAASSLGSSTHQHNRKVFQAQLSHLIGSPPVLAFTGRYYGLAIGLQPFWLFTSR